MACAFCGSPSAGADGICPSCGRVSSRAQVAAATATPVPSAHRQASGFSALGPLQLGQMFGVRYRILKVLGEGGMGVVYQAWDETLGVPVALKVIRRDALSDPMAAEEIERRFKRELLLARQVTHKNVVRIHDIGEVDGIKYITMPFIEGKDLATVLSESGGRLPLGRALAVIRQVAEGLAVAHEAGVVHRDLKPENVMIDAEGRALIMDFGISRSVSGGTTVGLTMTGAVVGTLEYMAPEQARGSAVDHRADLYALGLMLYDLLAGRQRVGLSSSAMAEMMARLEQPPPPLRLIAPDTPPAIEKIVAHAVEPDPAKRYQSAAEVLSDLNAFERGVKPGGRGRLVPLRTVAAIAILVLLAGGVAGWLWTRSRAGSSAARARAPVSVLIADFDNKTNDPVFEGSVEQALGIGLEGASFVMAYPRRDALRAAEQIGAEKLTNETAQLVAVREGIKVVLAGAIAPEGEGYLIRVRALDPADAGREIATTDARAGSKARVLDAVGSLASKLRQALGDAPTTSEQLRRETFTAESLEAAREYWLGQELSNANRDEEAIQHYRRAIALDPKFGRAYSGLASVEARLGRVVDADRHFQQALALADRMTDRERLRTFGAYYVQIKGDYEKGIQTYSELVTRYPADGAAHNNLAVAYFNTRDFQKALEEGSRVIEVYPRSVLYRYNYALYAMYAGDFATAERAARVALELNPNTPKAYLALAMSALAGGRTEEARQVYEKARTIGARGESLAAMGLADIAIFEGRYDAAIRMLIEGIRADQASGNASAAAAKQLALAEAQIVLGRKAAAVASVTAALQAPHSPNVAVPAAEILVAAGREAEALKLASELDARFSKHDRAAARLIQARVALARGRAADAVRDLREAIQDDDFWLVRYVLGSAYVEAGEPGLALTELDQCARRLGEIAAVFLDDVPSFRYRIPLMYWSARAQHGLKQAAAAQTFKDFLARRPADATDPLTSDARAILQSR